MVDCAFPLNHTHTGGDAPVSVAASTSLHDDADTVRALWRLYVQAEKSGYVFGGFASVSWSVPATADVKMGQNFRDSRACMFSLSNAAHVACKLRLKDATAHGAVHHAHRLLAVFGQGGADLTVSDKGSAWSIADAYAQSSYEIDPTSTTNANHAAKLVSDDRFFAGSREFQVAEMEVYQLTF